MTTSKRRIIYIVVIAVVAALVILSFLPDAVPVETVEVTSAPMEVSINARGETRLRDRFVIVAPVTGRLERISLREGAAVKAGDVVARLAPAALDPREQEQTEARVRAAEATLEEARAAARRAEAAADLASRERARIDSLTKEGVASQEALDQAVSAQRTSAREVDAAQARVSAAAAELQSVRATLSATRSGGSEGQILEVRSPVDGRVLRIPERSERVVQAGQTILEIGNAKQLELELDVLSEDAVKIEPGDTIRITGWGGENPLIGSVRQIEPSGFTKISALGIEEQRVNVIGEIDSPPPQLGDAYRVEGEVVVWKAPDALQVPVSALAREGDEWTVFVVESGRAVRRPVKIGQRNDRTAQILSGIETGARVIVHPPNDVRDGVRVEEMRD